MEEKINQLKELEFELYVAKQIKDYKKQKSIQKKINKLKGEK